MHNSEYSTRERFWLWCLAVFGFFTVNTAFVYGLSFQPGSMMNALTNPIAAAFIVESFLLLGALAYLLTRWGVSKLHWGWFVFLSLLGSMAFALPIILLWPWSTRTT